MEGIIRSVKDIERENRAALEALLGGKLEDDQSVIIRVVTIGAEPSQTARDSALTEASGIAAKGRQHASGLGLTSKSIDEAIDDAREPIQPR
jgi:hypothetical protein